MAVACNAVSLLISIQHLLTFRKRLQTTMQNSRQSNNNNSNNNNNNNKRARLSSSPLSSRPRKFQRIVSSLPPRMNHDQDEHDICSSRQSTDSVPQNNCTNSYISPQDYVLDTLRSHSVDVKVVSSLDLDGFFSDPTEEQMEGYSQDVINAVREQDIDALRHFHKSGRRLQCSNRFGESLLHMACRRGFVQVATFLIHEAGVTVRVKDDYGRTPLHDACWTCEPNMELLELILHECPQMMFLSDRRGHTPLHYARAEHWGAYVAFLRRSQDMWLPKGVTEYKQ